MTISFNKIRKNEFMKRGVKYLLHAIIIACTLKYVASCNVETRDILIISMISAIIFAILDMYSPALSE
jgi:hypothetical protein